MIRIIVIEVYMKRYSEKGQILLIVVLAMVVALTVGLSIASRIVTELKISKQNEESQRAFQAAEAGIQQTLKSGTPGTPITQSFSSNNSSFQSSIVNTGENSNEIDVNAGIDVDQDSGADVWLSTYNPDIALNYSNPMGCSGSCSAVNATIYWGDTSDPAPNGQSDCSSGSSGNSVAPAIEVVILYDKSDPKISKYVFDCGGRIPGATAADNAGPYNVTVNGENKSFRYRGVINFTEGLVMKVIPIFNSTKIAIQSAENFPKQGSEVTSTGTSGETQRRIKYFTSLPQLPIEVFPYSILSQ